MPCLQPKETEQLISNCVSLAQFKKEIEPSRRYRKTFDRTVSYLDLKKERVAEVFEGLVKYNRDLLKANNITEAADDYILATITMTEAAPNKNYLPV